jgi:hypothetical protein
VLTAVWLFKQAGKLYSRRIIEDSISNLSLESEIIETTSGTVHCLVGTRHPMLWIRDPVGSVNFWAWSNNAREQLSGPGSYLFDFKICIVFKTRISKYKAHKANIDKALLFAFP